jgi:tetratricopeptide (TPR) repeat protein
LFSLTIARHKGRAAMPSGPGERYDFFLSRRGSVAAIAQEVTDVLTEKGYRVFVQDYDIPITANFIEEMHEAVKNSRDLVVLFTRDYEQSPYTRMEFTSFEANAAQSAEHRRMVILRCEDVPLLGLFAPHVYQDLVGIGDGEERRSRILAALEGRSQALEPPPRPFIGVPPRIASFTGRADELDRLDAILMHDKPAAVTQASVGRAAVQGMGGVGKTSLAIEYVCRFRGLYAGVCWCPAETRTGLLNALASLAVTLGAATAEETDVQKSAKTALRRLAEQRATWLLVYDNVISPDYIGDLLPSAGARVLITSRFSDWSELADEVSLDVLPLVEAVTFLQNRTGHSDVAGAATLADAVGRLPLALDHAAAYCKRTQMNFADYAEKASSFIGAAPRGVGYPSSVAATFDLAIAKASAQCAAAEALMAFLANCSPERIPMELIKGALDEGDRLQALSALGELSLVKHDPFEDGTPAVTVHRLVQTVARTRAKSMGANSAALTRLIERLWIIYPSKFEPSKFVDKDYLMAAQLTPHLLTIQDADVNNLPNHADWPDLLKRAGDYFESRASEEYYYARLVDHTSYQKWIEGLRKVYSFLDERIQLSERAVAIRERTLGDHPETATSIERLARLLREKGDLASARPLLKRAIAIREKTLGLQHLATLETLDNLADVLRIEGNFAAEQAVYERAHSVTEHVLGAEHQYTARCLNNLAMLLREQGDIAGGRRLAERAFAFFADIRSNQFFLLPYVINLALLRQADGDLAGALTLFERALAINANNRAAYSSGTKPEIHDLALLALKVGRPTEAFTLGQTALDAHDKALGQDHPWTKNSARVTADALDALGRTEEAKALRERYGVTEAREMK